MMKKTYLTLFNFFVFFQIFSQIVEQPTFCCVSVGTDSLVRLQWQYIDTSNISGFIVKRIIYDGNGVVEGTLNNIEILGNVFFYIDNSYTYQTSSKPYLRSETYAISAYKTVENDVFYSPMTNLLKTIFLTYNYDSCSNILSLKWTKYINANVSSYEIWYGNTQDSLSKLVTNIASDTSIFFLNLEKEKNLFFVVKAIFDTKIGCNCNYSFSNFVKVYTKSTIAPQTTENIYTSVLDNNNIEITYFIDDYKNVKSFELYRDNSFISNIEANTFIYTDNTPATTKNCYYLKIIDLCNIEIQKSKTICSSVLDYKQIDNSIILNWNEILINESKPDCYIIEIEKNNNWEEFKNFSNQITSATIETTEMLPLIIDNQDQRVRIRVKATKNNINSFSSIADVFIEPILLIPEAVNPFSEIEENRYFAIKSLFVNSFSIKIFLPKGLIIFMSNDIQKSWDCRHKNEIVPPNAYIYNIEYTDKKGKKYNRKGIINVIY